MRIRELTLTKSEAAALHRIATANVIDRLGLDQQQAREYLRSLSPHNVLRLALGFRVRQRGGKRPGAGRRPTEPLDDNPPG